MSNFFIQTLQAELSQSIVLLSKMIIPLSANSVYSTPVLLLELNHCGDHFLPDRKVVLLIEIHCKD